MVSPTLTAHHFRNNGIDDPIAIAFHAKQDPVSSREFTSSATRDHGALGVMTFDKQITSDQNRARCLPDSPAPTLSATTDVKAIGMNMRPRRLTPREWERLQGFPDDYTLITVGKQPAKDTPRYQALGNSMAVPVMRWIGRRIETVDGLAFTLSDFG